MIQSNPTFKNDKMNPDFGASRLVDVDVPEGAVPNRNQILNGHQIPNTSRSQNSNEQFEFKLMTPDNRLITVPFYREETIGILKVSFNYFLIKSQLKITKVHWGDELEIFPFWTQST